MYERPVGGLLLPRASSCGRPSATAALCRAGWPSSRRRSVMFLFSQRFGALADRYGRVSSMASGRSWPHPELVLFIRLGIHVVLPARHPPSAAALLDRPVDDRRPPSPPPCSGGARRRGRHRLGHQTTPPPHRRPARRLGHQRRRRRPLRLLARRLPRGVSPSDPRPGRRHERRERLPLGRPRRQLPARTGRPHDHRRGQPRLPAEPTSASASPPPSSPPAASPPRSASPTASASSRPPPAKAAVVGAPLDAVGSPEARGAGALADGAAVAVGGTSGAEVGAGRARASRHAGAPGGELGLEATRRPAGGRARVAAAEVWPGGGRARRRRRPRCGRLAAGDIRGISGHTSVGLARSRYWAGAVRGLACPGAGPAWRPRSRRRRPSVVGWRARSRRRRPRCGGVAGALGPAAAERWGGGRARAGGGRGGGVAGALAPAAAEVWSISVAIEGISGHTSVGLARARHSAPAPRRLGVPGCAPGWRARSRRRRPRCGRLAWLLRA